MNFSETLFLFFAFLAFLLSILFLIKKRGDRTANVLLSIYLALFSYNILYNVLYWSKELYTQNFLHLVGTSQFTWILYAPILYLYVRRVTRNSDFKIIDLLHFVPLAFIVANFSPFLTLSTQSKIDVLVNGLMADYTLFNFQYKIELIVGLMIFYFIRILFFLKNELKSRNQKIWLKWLSFSFLGYVISFTSYFIFQRIGWVEIGYDHFIGFSMIFFIALVSYFGFLQPQVFDGLPVEKLIPLKKYRSTGLTKNHSLELKQNVVELMKRDKPYLNCELKLNDLAEQLNLSRHHMSQVINEQFDASFFDFINSYRIKEAERLLKENDQIKIVDVLYESGFSNRVSFNKAFKKQTGLTPTEYKSQL